MLRHVVLFRLKDDIEEGTTAMLLEGLSRLPGLIPDISSYSFGVDLGLAEGNYDLGIVAEFADAEALGRYAAHPAHQEFVVEKLKPVIAQRVALQFEI
jgi:hypothetical protein